MSRKIRKFLKISNFSENKLRQLEQSGTDLEPNNTDTTTWSTNDWHFGNNTQYPSLRSTEAINGKYLLLCGQVAPQVLTTEEARPKDHQCP